MAEKTITEAIQEVGVAGLSRVVVDGTTVEQMPIDDMIKAAEYEKKGTAETKNHLGMSFRTFVPGGTGGSATS